MSNICAICGKGLVYFSGAESVPYLERGITKKELLCPTCYGKKVLVRDYNANEKKRSTAVSFFEKRIVNKSVTIQNVVNAWINGEDQNYYTSAKQPVYYVEGPRASLFVFEDHITILSSFQPNGNREALDYIYFYKCMAQVSAKKTQEIKYFFAPYRNKYNLSDSEKINAKLLIENFDRWKQQTVELNISLGEYGTLDFGKKDGLYDICAYSFKFYYHQNQLMEEVYNYIQNRIANPDEITPSNSSGNTQTMKTKQVEKPSEELGASFSAADEIRKMKELFDYGIITQEEFDEAKKRLISKL